MATTLMQENARACVHTHMRTHKHASMPPKGSRECLISLLCLESQGCQLIPLSYLISCFSDLSSWSFWLVIFPLMVHSVGPCMALVKQLDDRW